MKLLKLAAAVLNQTPLDWDGNKANILAAIDDAKRQGVSILCLPEMCIPGYGCEDAFHSPGTHAMALQVLQEILPSTNGIVGFVGKRYLAGDGIHYEPRWFKPWPDDVRAEVTVGGQACPMGDIYFDVG